MTAIAVFETKESIAAFNASLNGLSAVLLILAFAFIKMKKVRAHAWTMIAALCSSAVFLVFYIASYLKFDERSSGLQPGPMKTFYLVMLATHVLLAVGMLPMIFLSLLRAYKRQWTRHHKVASPTFFIWAYVSITGVAVYWMLYHLFPSMKQ